jgi:hypothetical protein
MTSFDYTELKEYWKLKINALLAYKEVNTTDLTDVNWQTTLDGLIGREQINQFAIDICEDIYNKATKNVSDFPDDVDWESVVSLVEDKPSDDVEKYYDLDWKYQRHWEEITQHYFWLLDALGYTPVDDDFNNTTNHWENIKRLLFNNSLEEVHNDLTNFVNGISDILENPTFFPTDWKDRIVRKSDLDTVIAEKAVLQVKADEYDRIHAKLSGRISDAELDNFLNPLPCSHADYDNIKNERDMAQTDLVRITGERDTAISEKNTAIANLSAKELAIVEQIITDCELGTNTEKTLDKVIIRIKELIKDNDTINPTVKDEVIKLSKELELGDNFQQQLSNATTYSSLIDIQKQAFSSKLSESKSEISKYQSRSNWFMGLGLLSVGGLLILAYLLLKNKQQDNEEDIN